MRPRNYRYAFTCLTASALLFAIVSSDLYPHAETSSVGSPPPFRIGERLSYKIEWNPPWYLFFLPSMDAGVAELKMVEETVYKNRRALRIVFTAKSSGTLAKLAGVNVDDHFEFMTDPSTLCTFAVTKKILEGKRKRYMEVVYFSKERKLHIFEVNLTTRPHRVDKDKFIDDVPPCVRDVFSALYEIRLKDLDVGTSHRSQVGDNDTFKEVETRVEKREMVKTPSGRYETWRLNTVALLGGLFKSGGKFIIWLTTDDRKIPVKFEAKVRLGKISGKLQSIQAEAEACEDAGVGHKPNSVSLQGREDNHSSGPGIAPRIKRSTREHRMGHP